MFLQVIMAESDRPYHSFLWRDLKSGTPDVYEFQRLVFGDKASPYIAQAGCREHAKRNANEYPDAARTVLDSMYMDDTLDSVSNVAEVINLRRNLTAMMAQAGMKIRKWCSNEAAVMADVSPLDRAQGSIEIRDKTLPTIKALGVTWEASNDLLTFQYAAPSIPDQLTKRVVTSFAAKIFDPLQILCPFTIQAKILLQKVWSRGLTWDEKLPDDLSKSWKQWFEQLTQLRELKLRRCLRQDQSVDSQSVHTFVDASTQAYAAVSYIQNIYHDGTVSVVFIAAKSRVAPLN
jgi:hypothetical protein